MYYQIILICIISGNTGNAKNNKKKTGSEIATDGIF